MAKEMTAKKLLGFLSDLEKMDVHPILDGGWGIDALLGEQTRPHRDADFIIEKKDLEKVKKYFLKQGFEDQTEGDIWWHFFMESPDAIIDFLVIDIQKSGEAFMGPKENKMIFPKEAFGGKGKVDDQEVNCLPAAYRVRSLTKEFGVVVKNKYQITEKDCRDLIAVCRKFDIEIPDDYTEFMDSQDLDY